LAKVVTAFFTTAGFVVFLGATGAAVTWVRLQSAQLPADRALEVIPIEHFAEVGAVSLAIFVILALIAVVAVYAADPAGRRTDEMRHGLALLVTAEVVVAILLVDAAPGRKRIAVGLCVVVGVLGVVASMLPKKTPDEDPEVQRKEGATRTGWLARRLDWGDALWTRASAKLGPFIATEESVKPSLAEIDAAKERKKRDAGTGEPPTRWRRRLTVLAVFVCGLAALLVTVVFFLLFPDDKWVAGSVLVATAFAGVCFGVARASGDRFLPYGLAVFFSVVLFGALLSIARLYDDPQVSPAALVRAGNAGASGVVGLFIGRTDERYWFGAVSVDCEHGKPAEIQRGSGRIFSVPAEHVLDDEVGSAALVVPEGHDGSDEEPAGERALDLLEELVRRQPPGGAPPTTEPEQTEDTTTPSDTATAPSTTTPTETTPAPDAPPSNEAGSSRGGVAPSNETGTQDQGVLQNGETPDSGGTTPAPDSSQSAQSGSDDAAAVPQTLAVTGKCLHPPPRLIRLEPNAAAPGDSVEAIGANLQRPKRARSKPERRKVLLNGIQVKAVNWNSESVTFEVPTDGARSGTVRVRVRGRKSNGLPLTVSPNAPPTAAVSVEQTARSRRFILDGTASEDPEEGPLRYRWRAAVGKVRTPENVTTTYKLPPGKRSGSVTLTVIDDHDQPSEPTPKRVEVRVTKWTLLERETFEFGKAALSDLGVRRTRKLRDRLARHVNEIIGVKILGYADFVGPDDFNQRLSEDRASTVEEALVAGLGVPKEIRTVKGFGDRKAEAQTWNDPARARDRRVDVVVTLERQ
jgi:outer membrane protein OmpA-like peptidoglycan-associated protein